MREASAVLLEEVSKVVREDFEAPVQETLDYLVAAPKIFVYGVGRSGLVGKAFAMRMVQLGLRGFFIGETITPIVEPEDVVLTISKTGETMSAIQTANIARRVGAHVVTVTASPGSKLAHASTIVLPLQASPGKKAASIAPLGTLFENAAFLLLDSLVSLLMERLGQTEADMRGRHAIMV